VGFVFKALTSGGKAVAEGALNFGGKAFRFTKDIAMKLLLRLAPLLAMAGPAGVALLTGGVAVLIGKYLYDNFFSEDKGAEAPPNPESVRKRNFDQGQQFGKATGGDAGHGQILKAGKKRNADQGQQFGKATGGDAGHGQILRAGKKRNTVTRSESKSGSKSPTKSIPNKSVTGGKEGELLDFIASKESGGAGGYAAVYGVGANPDILNMTVAEVMQYQDELIAKGQKSSAMGRYQFIKSTLSEEAAAAGVDINKEVFSPHFQDALILHRLRRIRGLDKFMSGEMDKNQFGEELAKEFASMPQPSTGKSRYAGVAGNKALTTNEEVGNVLDNLRPENRSQNGAISGGKSSSASGTQQNTAKQGILERAMEAVSNVKDALFGGDGGATVINNNTNQNNVNNGGGGSKRPDIGDRNLENNLNPTSSYY
jgi:muramidase (phage lysozyme)